MEEKVKDFDRKLEKYEDFNILMGKVCRFLFEGIWSIILMIPIQEYDRKMRVVIFMGLMFSFWSIFLYLNVYIYARETTGQAMPMYRKLRYFPVSLKEVFLVRFHYLWRYCKIKLTVYLLLQAGVAFLMLRTLSVWNVLYPLLWVMIGNFLPGVFMIFPWKMNAIHMTELREMIFASVPKKG